MKKLAIALGLIGGLMLALPSAEPTYAQSNFFQDLSKLAPWNAGKGDLKPAKKKKKATKKKAAKKAMQPKKEDKGAVMKKDDKKK